MEKKLLLISRGSTFMVDAISSNLREAGFTVKKCEPAMKEIAESTKDIDIILFYLGDYLDDIKEDIVYLKDICIEREISLSVIGDDAEVNVLRQTVAEGQIANVFSRPLDIKNLVSVMENVAQGREAQALKKNILLVDDDASFLKMVKDWLSDDYRVTIVSSGMQAITYIAKNRPDLILLDYEMPVTSGPQALEMIRSEVGTSNLPVFFLTGKGDKESVTKVLTLKPEGYILKSAGKNELVSQIKDYFERHKSV
ncbi:MAG: response regulator [Butyrivibrio sp.]|uniref:response regulator n=1 Tax=Butyrivibrio sp. TaxID=28121 RepID=UPI001B171E92|nr:response regulator [Butyrivibrio sp.]MBO6241338.1 response regulator [Butyrivibrio sp.]